jgi:hypothetical protein
MIHIKSQDGSHQYDDKGNSITTWDAKKCTWIVNKEYENENIDWYGEDSDFPAGMTLKQYKENHPYWDKLPDITVIWSWKNREAYYNQFQEYPQKQTEMYQKLGHLFQACDMRHAYEEDKNFKFPYIVSRSWGYLDYTKEQAMEYLACYCDFNKFSTTKVIYNGEIIFKGKLEK